MSKNITILILLLCLYQSYNSAPSKKPIKKPTKKSPRPKTTFNATTKYASTLKFHSKLLQTVYSDSFSKNYYYTTLYVGDKKVKQTYLLDTGSALMSSPCSPCAECGSHKNHYFYDFNHYHKPLQCKSKICNLVPANNCYSKTGKNLNKNSCSFNYNKKSENENKNTNTDIIKGYYLRDIVYLETNQIKSNKQPYKFFNNKRINFDRNKRTVFRSYALPIGCTNAEYGEYRNLKTDGIMGLNNSPKSFISVLYNLKIIPENKFSLCFGLYGGYMSLGEIESAFHKEDYIEYVHFVNEKNNYDYLINIKGISLDKKSNFVSGTHIASIESSQTKTYFPESIYKSIIKEFDDYCSKKKNATCGKFNFYPEGYCAVYPNRVTLFKSMYSNWPNITLHLDDFDYVWSPIHYYYYSYNNVEHKACLGFAGHKSQKIILGTNFFHGHDIIFDRTNKRLGIVPADCSRGFMLYHRGNDNKSIEFTHDPSLVDLEFHKDNVFKLGDNTNKDVVDFVEGHNTELDLNEEFKAVNFFIFLTSMIIVGIIVVVILFILFWNKKGNLKYEPKEEIEYKVEQQNEDGNNYEENNRENEGDNAGEGEGDNQEGDNKISFEENNTNNDNENNENELKEKEETEEKEDNNNEDDK